MFGSVRFGRGVPALAGLMIIVACSCAGNSDTDVISYDFIHGFDIHYGDDVPDGVDIPVGTECKSDDDCDSDVPHCLVARGICVECVTQSDCQGRGFCLEGYVCGVTTCQPDEAVCVKNVAKVCNADGSHLQETDCSIEGKYCVEGACYACPPNLGDCPSDTVARRCKADGTGWEQQTCGSGLTCANGDCLACIPGEYICDGSTKVKRCAMDGSGFIDDKDCWELHDGDICHMGQCINLCEFTSKFYTNKGCEYYAIDMEQYRDAEPPYYGEDAPFAVVVSNTYEHLDATVKVYQGDTLVKTANAPAGLATIINLEPLNLYGAGITDQTYRVVANLPIVAYQFNPLENVEVFSNDASLLLPTSVLGRNYRVVSMPNLGLNSSGQYLSSNIAIVAVEEGDTEITITPTANVIAGTNTLGVKKGFSENWTMQQGEVFNVLPEMTQFLDLTGTLIEADKKIAVFSGHSCSVAPLSTCVSGKCSYDKGVTCASSASCPIIGACDHLEEQIQPIEAWGKEYVLPKTKARGLAPDLVRVVANHDNTRVTITPPVAGSKVLNKGEFYEFEIDRSVVVKSDEQFLASIILEGESAPGAAHVFCSDSLGENCTATYNPADCSCSDDMSSCNTAADCSDDAGVGDPSLIIAVPTEQYRDFYIFLVPTKYADSYVSIVAPTDATSIKLDNTTIAKSEFTTISGTAFMTAVKHVNPGSHTLESDKSVGLYVYGWDSYVSYGYPGGMMLLKIAGDMGE